jgi:hypothetical protein
MIYEQNVTQRIIYTYEDLLVWLRTFAAKQFGVNPETINEDDIILNGITKECEISVSHVKITSNQKEERIETSS